MKIEVNFKEHRMYEIKKMVFIELYTGEKLQVESEESYEIYGSEFSRGQFVIGNATFASMDGRNKYVYQDIDEIPPLILKEIVIYDKEDRCSKEWVDIESIVIRIKPQIYNSTSNDTGATGHETYVQKKRELPVNFFSKFHTREIIVDDEHFFMTEEKYRKLADTIMQQEILEDYNDAVRNNLYEEHYSNVREYLLALAKTSASKVAEEFSTLHDYTGEEERDKLNSIIIGRGGIYHCTFISNKGTENEVENKVLLMNEQIELYKEMIKKSKRGTLYLGNETLYDVDGDLINMEYVDQIISDKNDPITI